jgi:hypothetical protein
MVCSINNFVSMATRSSATYDRHVRRWRCFVAVLLYAGAGVWPLLHVGDVVLFGLPRAVATLRLFALVTWPALFGESLLSVVRHRILNAGTRPLALILIFSGSGA